MRNLILAVSGLALGVTACSTSTSAPPLGAPPVAALSVTLPSATLLVGQSQLAAATPRDANGTPLSDRTISWRSSVPAIAGVDAAGTITAIAPGTTLISASAEGVSGSAGLTVVAQPPVPVSSVSVSLSASSVVAGQSARATAVIRDAAGNSLSGRVVTWQSSNRRHATVRCCPPRRERKCAHRSNRYLGFEQPGRCNCLGDGTGYRGRSRFSNDYGDERRYQRFRQHHGDFIANLTSGIQRRFRVGQYEQVERVE